MYDPFYMPLTEEVIAILRQAQFLFMLDLAKGFHQVPMAGGSKDLTTLSFKFGKYRYLRMPFGLKNAPSTFEVMMQRCLFHLRLFHYLTWMMLSFSLRPGLIVFLIFLKCCPA